MSVNTQILAKFCLPGILQKKIYHAEVLRLDVGTDALPVFKAAKKSGAETMMVCARKQDAQEEADRLNKIYLSVGHYGYQTGDIKIEILADGTKLKKEKIDNGSIEISVISGYEHTEREKPEEPILIIRDGVIQHLYELQLTPDEKKVLSVLIEKYVTKQENTEGKKNDHRFNPQFIIHSRLERNRNRRRYK